MFIAKPITHKSVSNPHHPNGMTGGYKRNGEQWARGAFLVLFTRCEPSYWTFNGKVVSSVELQEDEARKVCGEGRRFPFGPGNCKEELPDVLVLHGQRWITNEHGGMVVRAFVIPDLRMHQCGHFMMGHVDLKLRDGTTHPLSLSGTYGGDGLPCDADLVLWDRLHELPLDLQDTFWRGGGHNGAGAEGPAMRKWAEDNYRMLTHLKED